MHYEELVELNTMGRELDEDEKKMLKKDAWSKCGKGVILLLLLTIAVGVVVFILFAMDKNNLYLRGRGVYKLFIGAIVLLIWAIVYIFVTFKHSILALIYADKAKMVEVKEVNFKELDKAGYKHYGDIMVKINGVVKTLEVPIMRDSVKMVMWQRKGKLYFVPDKYYMLGMMEPQK